MQFNITCDNHLTVYMDEKLLGEGTTNVENKGFHQYQLTAGSHMIALKPAIHNLGKEEYWDRLKTEWSLIPLGNAPTRFRKGGI